ncbi:YciI family protein [Kutzneria viridogrisea]|uniref:YCII-related domain-containing protein n=2 Tax=Kutzneria TaxID=43356 RepID=W5WLJ2_9PSEU|nr:YciI family protein [Kutzneria albida]AHI01437.1 hypothetical protein KALB_8079 [Kutzneria albida DSM 43870]MBA8931397.1 hypothetical protein [Kutzneria viridogrisea]
MKYLLLIYSNPENWSHPVFRQAPGFRALPQGEQDTLAAQAGDLFEEITTSGEFVLGSALGAPADTRSVRVREGVPVATDGPYLEAKEHLAGYFVLDCASPERAAEIAARFPDARFGAVEVRPILDMTERQA